MKMADARDEPAHILTMVAHELKNALGSLAMTLQIVDQRVAAGVAVEPADVKFARAQVRRLSELVADLMDAGSVDADQLSLEPTAVDLRAVVDEAAAAFRRAHPDRTLAVVSLATPVVVTADARRILAVVTNYLENAAKYSAADCPIEVRVVADGASARIEVADAGPGIAPEHQANLFRRFYRAPGAAARARGLGLGLYLCRVIAERHGGSVGVSSELDRGATFWVALPRG